jgi:hypothetical protein
LANVIIKQPGPRAANADPVVLSYFPLGAKFADHHAITRCDQQSSRARDTRKFFARAVSHMGCKADDVGIHWRANQRCWWLQD